MTEKIKSKLLTYLFKDWVKNETDLETLELTISMIKQRENILNGHGPTGRTVVKGFGGFIK